MFWLGKYIEEVRACVVFSPFGGGIFVWSLDWRPVL